nr:immunoglobulin heavy chain junction region [Macaca mulatta]MOX67574.1 immunoglobulin heavy chain junction region [Macaca mulatta]
CSTGHSGRWINWNFEIW